MGSKHYLITLIVGVVILLSAPIAYATTITVSPGESIQTKCLDKVNPGDNCIVKPGIYNEGLILNRPGTRTSPITITCESSKACTINSGINKSITTSINAAWITLNNFQFISTSNSNTILLWSNWVGETANDSGHNGLVIKNCYIEGAISIYGSENIVENCELNGKGTYDNGILERFAPSHDNIYRNNRIYGYFIRGIWSMQRTRNTVIEGNEIFNIVATDRESGHGVDCDGAAFPVYNCRVIGNTIHDLTGYGIEFENGFEGSGAFNNHIYHVRQGISAINYGVGYTKQDIEYRDKNTGIIIDGNTIHDTRYDGIICHASPGVSVSNNMLQRTNSDRAWFGAIGLIPLDGYPCHNWNINHNTISPIGMAIHIEGNPSGIGIDNNVYYLSPSVKKFNWKSGSDTLYTFSEWKNARSYDIHSNITSASPTPQSGDTNGDSKVDGIDYVVWLSHYNQNVTGATNGDYNNSGKVDGIDYVLWLNSYEK